MTIPLWKVEKVQHDCLLLPAEVEFLCKYFIFYWGGWWGSNPRHPEPQSGVLPLNYSRRLHY